MGFILTNRYGTEIRILLSESWPRSQRNEEEA